MTAAHHLKINHLWRHIRKQ